MGHSPFARKLAEGLNILRETLEEYFAQQTQIAIGIKPAKIVEQPEALKLLRQSQDMNDLPLYGGGVLDQPYITVQELHICRTVEKIFDAIPKQGQNSQGSTKKEL